MLCRFLALPLALFSRSSDLGQRVTWAVTDVWNTTTDGTTTTWPPHFGNPAVRLAVFYADHYSPCVLERSVEKHMVPPCRNLPTVVGLLCAKIAKFVPAVLELQVPAREFKVFADCCE